MNKPMTGLGAGADRARFTTAEFVRMAATGAFEDMKVELVRGELTRMNPPRSEHARLQGDIFFRLRTICAGSGLDAFGEVGIDLGDDTLVGCDAALVRRADDANRMLRPTELVLVIEVALTTLERDLGLKRQAYARAAIPNYWVIDGEGKRIHVFGEPIAGDYSVAYRVAFADSLPVPGFAATITLD